MKTDTPATPYPTFFSLRIRWAGFLGAFGFFVGAVSLAGYLSAYHWIFDLFCHFRFQYVVSLTVVAVGFAVLRNWKSAALVGIIASINAWTLVPYLLPTNQSQPMGGVIREALQINVERGRGDKGAVGELIQARDPDLVLLSEIDSEWLETLSPALETFPYRLTEPRTDHFGIAFFSKFPFERSKTLPIGPVDLPSTLAVVEFPETDVLVLGTHTIPPGNARRTPLRNRQLAALGTLISEATHPTLLMGDLNTSPWSFHFQDMLRVAGLKDSGIGWGFQPTWSANNWFLWTPIDHFLHTSEIRVLDRKIGPDVGSDHYPLIVRFAVEKQRETPENPNHERNAEE